MVNQSEDPAPLCAGELHEARLGLTPLGARGERELDP